MNTYFKFLKNSFLESIVYRYNVFFGILGKFLFLFVQLSLWHALYETNTDNKQNLSVVVTYTILANVFYSIADSNVTDVINKKITSGEIAIDLMRPYSFSLYLFSYSVGKNISNLILYGIPLIVISIIVFGLKIAIGAYLLLYVFSVILSIMLVFLFNYFIGLLSFWLISTHQLSLFVNSFMKLFSGVWISVWFFPRVFRNVSAFLPFQYMYYAPTSIISTQVINDENVSMVVKQFIWVAILFMLVGFLWYKGRKKIVVQGG